MKNISKEEFDSALEIVSNYIDKMYNYYKKYEKEEKVEFEFNDLGETTSVTYKDKPVEDKLLANGYFYENAFYNEYEKVPRSISTNEEISKSIKYSCDRLSPISEKLESLYEKSGIIVRLFDEHIYTLVAENPNTFIENPEYDK